MTRSEKQCPTCGVELSPGATEGLCLKCLGNLGFFSETMPAGPESLMRLGDFVLLEEIGRGGMGVVYRARQTSLNRMVALKVVLHGPFSSPDFVRRFRHEAEAVAALRHPNIVSIYDIGQEAGNHFIALEFIDGQNFAELTRHGPLPARRAAGYMKTVAEAVEHAHQRGVLHRDLTPSNILLDAFDQPRVTDFGLAKLANAESELTLTGQVLGSPSFMSPEQAQGKLADATPRSDVYSLGAILYVLLTGRPPFQAESLSGILAQVQDAEALPPQRLNPDTPPDLQTICLKCLQKEPSSRYASAQALADDLDRFLRGEPILARPVPAWERAVLWSRRRPLLAALGAGLLLAVALGISGILWQWRNAEFERGLAEKETGETRLNLYAADVAMASQAIKNGDLGLARRTLDGLRPRGTELDLRGFEWRYLWNRCQGDQLAILGGHAGTVTGAAFSPDGALLATCSEDPVVQIWRARSRAFLTRLEIGSNAPWSMSFTPDGKQLMTANATNIEFWDTNTWRVRARFPGRMAVLSKLGTFMATSESLQFYWEASGPVKFWNWRTGQLLRVLDRPGRALALSADGRLLAAAGINAEILVWDTATGRLLHDWPGSNQVCSLDFSPDGKHLLSTAWASSDISLWSLAEEAPPAKITGHLRHVWSAVYSADGAAIASASSDQTVRIWDAATLQPKSVLRGHTSEVWCVAFSPDGRLLATGGKDGNVMLWPATPARRPDEIPHDMDFHPLFSPDGKWIATAESGTRNWMLWNTADSTLVDKKLARGKMLVGFSADGKEVVTFEETNSTLKYWLPNSDAPSHQTPLQGGPYAGPCQLAAMAPASDFFFSINPAGLIQVWNTRNGQLVRAINGPPPRIRNAVLSPSGRQIAVCVEEEHIAHLFDCATGVDHPLTGHRDFVSGLAFSPDGSIIATGSMDGTLRLWHTRDGSSAGALPGHMEETTDVAFSPDGRTLASICRNESFKLWHVPTLREVVSEDLPTVGIYLVFSPDGKELAVETTKNSIRLLAAPEKSSSSQYLQFDGN